MTTATAARRKRAVTPINDFAQTGRQKKSITRLNTLRFQYQLKRSNMFSLAVRGIKWFGYLFVTLLLLLLVLNFQLVHNGRGSFKIAAKDQWAFSGTFITSPDTDITASNVPVAALEPVGVPGFAEEGDVTGFSTGLSTSRDTEAIVNVDSHVVGENHSQLGCLKNKNKIAAAVTKYNQSNKGMLMKNLEIFSLLSEGYINELVNCPSGGQYSLSYDRQTGKVKVSCTGH